MIVCHNINENALHTHLVDLMKKKYTKSGFTTLIYAIIASIITVITMLLGMFFVKNTQNQQPHALLDNLSDAIASLSQSSDGTTHQATVKTSQRQQKTQTTPQAPTPPGNTTEATEPPRPTSIGIGAVSRVVVSDNNNTNTAQHAQTATTDTTTTTDTQQTQDTSSTTNDATDTTDTATPVPSGAVTPGAKSDGTDGFVADAGGASALHGEIWDYCGRKDAEWMSQKWNKACARSKVTGTFTNVAKKSSPGTLTLTICGDHDDPCKHGDVESGHNDCGHDFSGGEVMHAYIDDVDLGLLFSTFADDDRFGGLKGGPSVDRGTIQAAVMTGTAQLTADEIARITQDGKITLTFDMPYGGMVDIYPGPESDLHHDVCSWQEYIKIDLQY